MKNITEKKINIIKEMSIDRLCEKFKCTPEEICFGDYIARETHDTVCPYKVILGFANFEGSDVTSLGNLEVVLGKKLIDNFAPFTNVYGEKIFLGVNFANSKIESTENLKKVYGSIRLNKKIKSLDKIKYLGSNLYTSGTDLEDFGDLQEIVGILSLDDFFGPCKIKSLNKIKRIGTLHINTNSLKDFGDVEEISSIIIDPKHLNEMRNLIIRNFSKRDGKHRRKQLNNTVNNIM